MAYNLLINGVLLGVNPLILTFDPNFQRDIQTYGMKCLQQSFTRQAVKFCSLGPGPWCYGLHSSNPTINSKGLFGNKAITGSDVP